MGAKLVVAPLLSVLATTGKRVKAVYGPQKVSKDDNVLLRSTKNTGGWGNSFSTIGVSVETVTNFWSRFAIRGSQIHWDSVRSGQSGYP